MLSVGQAQNNPVYQPQEVAVSRSGLSITEIAIIVLKTLGVLLAAAGILCLIAGQQVPAIALIISGIASWLLGHALSKQKEASVELQPLFTGTPEELQAALDAATANFGRIIAPLMALPEEAPIQQREIPAELPPLAIVNRNPRHRRNSQ